MADANRFQRLPPGSGPPPSGVGRRCAACSTNIVRAEEGTICLRCDVGLHHRCAPEGRCPTCGETLAEQAAAWADERARRIATQRRRGGMLRLVGGLALLAFSAVCLVADPRIGWYGLAGMGMIAAADGARRLLAP